MLTVKLFLVGLLAWLCAGAAVAAPACGQHSLRIAVVPQKNMDTLVREQRPLVERLTQALGMPVEIVPASSYESVVDAIVSGGVDIAWLGPAAYLLAYQRDPRIEPFATLTMSHGYFTPPGPHYQALLLTLKGGASHIEALRGLGVALTDPASTSGSVVPNAEFSARVSQPLGQFFGSVVYSGSHDKSLDALLAHKVDAAFVASERVDAYLDSGRIDRNTFNVLWRSQPIFYDPYVFSGRLCPALKAKVRSAMLSDPQGLAGFFASQQATAMVPVSHADYAPLLKIMGRP
ncbi:phosphate/phosphite/phosphonate ABC transporter substrate-binding protein [Pseudomonas sp. NPDC007930]|uniref:phosphate/phosphite/phosphonate ABC transporter substrate-binding protein n=1 Tax=Pseudomonas sp. NPDC007930 TaxID=3364417 RepID=UPI0036E30D0E